MAYSKNIQQIIKEQNPWWEESRVPRYLALRTERLLAQYLWKSILSKQSARKKHSLILGPRRVGKTTVMYQTVRYLLNNKIPPNKIQWVRIDHPEIIPLSLGEIVKDAMALSKATPKAPLYLFLDELVYAKNWDRWLKTFYDEHWPVIIIASSSATAALQKGKESGVGRWNEFYLPPYNLKELLSLYKKDTPNLQPQKCLSDTIRYLASNLPHTYFNFKTERETLITYGGFPEVLNEKRFQERVFLWREKRERERERERHSDKRRERFDYESFKEYRDNRLFQQTQQILKSDAIERAIYKDIPQSYNISNPMNLEKLLYSLAGQVTGLLSLKDISKDIGPTVATLEHYLFYLTQAYLVFTLSNYDNNERGVQRRYRKIYFVDIAIRNAALLKDKSQILQPSELGKFQENLLAGHFYHLGEQAAIRVYHWRRGKHEVDFIYNDLAHQPLAFELGSSEGHSRKALKKFLKENSKFKNGTYYVAPNLNFRAPEDSESGIGELPLDLLLFATGLQSGRVLSLM